MSRIIAKASVHRNKLFMRNLLVRSVTGNDPDNISVPDAEELDSDSGSVFSTRTVHESELTDIYGVPAGGHGNQLPRGVRVQGADIDLQNPRRALRTPFADLSTSEKANSPADSSNAPTSSRKRRRNR